MRSTRERQVFTGWRVYSASSISLDAVVVRMMRLLMEAVMVIAIVSGMVFVSKMSAGDEKPKDTKPRSRDEDKDIESDDWPYR
jgi:hypothetical protein